MKLALGGTFLLLSYLISSSANYQAKYVLTYHPDSTNLDRIEVEHFILFLRENKESFSASENFLKKDSISLLIKNGVLSEGDVAGNSKNRFKTKFPQFIHKKYSEKSINLFETIGLYHYHYVPENTLNWKISLESDTIVGYRCTKATTSYAGRDYEAWFAPDIPISDGPYIFWGLPGLIVKLSDTQNHYSFLLEEFKEYHGRIIEMPTYRKQQPITIDRSKAFALREDFRKDPFGAMSRVSGRSMNNITIQRSGSADRVPIRSNMQDRSWDNNPMELK